jgi:hypothetical protein
MLSDIYFFNPTCEPAIANGSPYYTAPVLLRKMESDLSYLPGWLGCENDVVLVQGTVDSEFSDKMRNCGFRLPEFINLNTALSDQGWLIGSINCLRPWGWSPAVCQLFKSVLPSCSVDFQQSAVAEWLPEHKKLFSRLTAAGLLERIIRDSSAGWLPDFTSIPVICQTLEQIHRQVDRHEKAVVKTPWSSSGRGLLIFPNVDTGKKNDELLTGMLNQQGFVTVEPWLGKVLDLSYQFSSLAGKISYHGRTYFETDRKGRYVRNFLTDDVFASAEVTDFLREHNSAIVSLLLDALSQGDYNHCYEGWIGVDALIYRTSEGGLKFHPVVEINGRYTMGAIALKIREYLATGTHGFMQVYYSKHVNFQDFCLDQEAKKPLILDGKKIISGFMPLTPPLQGHHFGAYIEVNTAKTHP